jgi:hypothetical protein
VQRFCVSPEKGIDEVRNPTDYVSSGEAGPRKPDPLRDIYRVSIVKAFNAARDPEIPMELVPEFVDAAAFFGEQLGKTWDDVMNDCIDHSIAEMDRDDELV